MLELKYIHLLKKGSSVRTVSEVVGVSYHSVCHHLREIGYNRLGEPTLRAKVTPRMTRLYQHVLANSDTLQEASALLNASKEQVSRMITRLGLRKVWLLESNYNQVTATGRRAEMFVIDLRQKWLVRDCYKAKSGGRQFPYDLILKGQADLLVDEVPFTGGSVDVKHAPLKRERRAGYKSETEAWSFSVNNFGPKVKWAALVGYDETKEKELVVFLVPGKLVAGHSTIRINRGKSKYNAFRVWGE